MIRFAHSSLTVPHATARQSVGQPRRRNILETDGLHASTRWQRNESLIPQHNRYSSSPVIPPPNRTVWGILQAPQRPGRNVRASTVSAMAGETDANSRPGQFNPERHACPDLSTTHHTAGGRVLLKRNRGDFALSKGNRSPCATETASGWNGTSRSAVLCLRPIYDEIYYDTSTSAWVPNRYAAGVQVPAGDLRQNDHLDTPQQVNALGLTFNFYF